MSEKNNIFDNDLLMRAILDGGQEEVPGRVWEAVSKRLDEAEGKNVRKPVKLWWSRAGVAAAGIAAVITAVLMIGNQDEATDILPLAVQEDMIAVVEPEAVTTEDTVTGQEIVVSQTSGAPLLAYTPKPVVADNHYEELSEVKSEVSSDIPDEVPETVVEKEVVTSQTEDWADDWAEETPARNLKTSFVVSGLTGGSESKTSTNPGPLKAPAVITMPSKTGIKEKENQTQYGIPVSIGAGVRIEFSPRWSLGVGLNYTHLSRVLQGTYTHVNEAGSIDDMITSQIKNHQHYLGLPVNLYFNMVDSKNMNFYAYTGGTVEKCLSDKYHVLDNGIIHKEDVKGAQLSAAIGLGAEFMLNSYLGLYIDPSLRYYFDCDQPKSIRTAQPLMFNAEVGLRFRL